MSLSIYHHFRYHKADQDGQIVIQSAVYGLLRDEAKTADVTHNLSSRISMGKLEVTASHLFLGIDDPAEGEKKQLRVNYFYAGKERSDTVWEENTLLLP